VSEELLKVLAHATNRAILNLLAVEPTYPRKIGDLLALPETEVARRLKHMEALGLVGGTWTYIGKNVKLYRLLVRHVLLDLGPEGLRLELVPPDGEARRSVLLNPFEATVPAPAQFVGRESELGALAGPEAVVLVEGMAGIGKTSLLALFAQAEAGSRPLFWHSFRGVESLNWLANRLAVFFAQHGHPALLEAIQQNAELADRRELMLQGLDDERWTVVLDDAHRIEDDAVRSFVEDAIERVHRGRLRVAGREPLRRVPSRERVRVLLLAGLTDEEVTRFLRLKEVELAPGLLPRLRDEIGGHPLALNLLLETAREQGQGLERLLDRIPEKNLEEYLLQEIYTVLADDERQFLTLASLFRTSFELGDVAALTSQGLEHALFKLRRRLLVQPYDGRYVLHEIIRNFFYRHLQDKPRLHTKAAGHYLALGTVEGRLEAMHHYLQAGRRDVVLDLLKQNLDLKEFDYIDAGYHHLYLSVLELYSADEVKDPRRWALIEDEKGDIRYHRGEFQKALAHYDEAVAYFEPAQDTERQADLAWKRALALRRLDQLAEAMAACEEGLRLPLTQDQGRQRLEALRAELSKKPDGRRAARATVA
jgi:tetratricopeptide (TPR) repeat protein